MARAVAASLVVRPLDRATWPAFERLAARHNGVWGGCWCLWFHRPLDWATTSSEEHRAEKRRRVDRGEAHAALVFDGPEAVGWCQFGSPAELPRVKHRREYEAGRSPLPDWRITCFFVDRGRRKEGVARAALDGALREIARLGGGTVEAYPEEVRGRSVSGSFLWSGTASMFERVGFERARPLGAYHWVVHRTVRSRGAVGRSPGTPRPERARPATRLRELSGQQQRDRPDDR